MLTDWVIAGLVIVSAVALAFALPLGSLARIGIVVIGVCLGLGATQVGLSEGRTVSSPVVGPNGDASEPLAQAKRLDQVIVTYRVTGTVRVNGEPRSGSSLQTGVISRNDLFGSQRLNTVTRFFGEAVAVPVVDDAYLLVTMRDGPGNRSYEGVITSPCWDIFDYAGSERPTADEVLTNAASFSEPCFVAENRLPLMVLVTDGGIDAELRQATPENLSELFGAEVEFVGLTFSPTTTPLEFHLNEQLSWIDAYMSGEISSVVPIGGGLLKLRRQDIIRRNEDLWQ